MSGPLAWATLVLASLLLLALVALVVTGYVLSSGEPPRSED